MESLILQFKTAYRRQDGYGMAAVFTPVAPQEDPSRLYAFHRSSNVVALQNDLRSALLYHEGLDLSKQEGIAWIEVFSEYWFAIGELLMADESLTLQERTRDVDWSKAYRSWKKLTDSIIRGFQTSLFPYWGVPLLTVAGNYLRNLAIKADESLRQKTGNVTYNEGLQDDFVSAVGKNENLSDAARQINRMFSACLADRAPIEESRKWGLYAIANLLFKTYFALNNTSLAKNMTRSLSVTEMPHLEEFPKSHQVTFNYYVGVISFLDEDYEQAEQYLQNAWTKCHPSSKKNLELILTYLIPCHLIRSRQLPTEQLLAPFPRLISLFLPLALAIKHSSLLDLEAALQVGETYFVKRRIYLTLERTRDIVLRNLFRKVFLAGGYEPLKDGQTEADRSRRTRVPIDEFVAGVRLSSSGGGKRPPTITDKDEVECLLANMIYKGYMKGYIHRERGIVVLSKSDPFPGTRI